MKSEYATFLRSKGKVMAVTLSDDEVSDNESGSDEDGNFIAFTATTIVNESVAVEENTSDGELSEDTDLQKAYNKLCKVAAKDDMSGFDDELSATEIAYLTKNFRNFLRNNNRRVRGKNNAKPRNFRRNDPTKVNNTKNLKRK